MSNIVEADVAVVVNELPAITKLSAQYSSKTFRLLSNNHNKLVVLYCWLNSKDRHINKYCRFLLERRFDVLCVKVTLEEALLPKTGVQRVARKVVEFLNDCHYESFIFYALSVGSYVMGTVTTQFVGEHKELAGKVRGFIIDSPVDFDHSVNGIIRSISSLKIVQSVMRSVITVLLRVLKSTSGAHQKYISKFVHDNVNRYPTLVFYSLADRICNRDTIENFIRIHRENSIPIICRNFKSTPHVQHYQFRPEDYLRTLDKFLAFVYKQS